MTAVAAQSAGARRRISLHVHLDPLWTYLRLAGRPYTVDAPDPAYTKMMPRLMSWAEGAGARLSIYVVGQDLQVPAHADLIRKWHAAGHEIGSHSWSHPPQMTALPSREVEAEIRQAHAIITDVIGQAPKGYTAPGWSNDERVKPWLRALDYEYDCSSFPAWPMLAIPALLLLFSAPEARKSIRLVRSDWRNVVFGSKYTRLAVEGDGKGMALSPVPLALLRLPIWHSVALALPWRASRLLLRTSMSSRCADYFYVVHPMDFFDPEQDASAEGLEAWRSGISLAKRMDIWNRVTAHFAECDVIPMREIMGMLRHQQTAGQEAA